jgi:hypothetical protein
VMQCSGQGGAAREEDGRQSIRCFNHRKMITVVV